MARSLCNWPAGIGRTATPESCVAGGHHLCRDGGRLAVCGRRFGLLHALVRRLGHGRYSSDDAAVGSLGHGVETTGRPRASLRLQRAIYQSGFNRQCLALAGVIPSMSRLGNCYDITAMESFWSSLKRELVH